MSQPFTLKDLDNDLGDKRKTVDDIVRFVENRNDENPNYNLLLGSGCSVTSGIGSGYALTEKWRKEIYLSLQNNRGSADGGYDVEQAKIFLQSHHHSKWYDPRNEYASLFEYKYNLPKQRRIFIEELVRDKDPSIGYAYLVKLIESNFFRTVFTTNFDDLINYSFYNFSRKCRPMVCAHDSSINSISVTSERPKIIKLHGDYLFDDIKNTSSETESLDDNMKNKFMEFSKDHGLIVVGYGGGDRSVMDVLTRLLKHEEYFGHGIYWCIRDGDDTPISEEVRKLLWKERVYYVPIVGFDELFAELSSKLSKNSILPYDTKITGDVMEFLKEIEGSEKAFSNCKYIVSDLKKCKEQIRTNAIRNQWKTYELDTERKIGSVADGSSFEEAVKLWEIRESVLDKKYDAAISAGLNLLNTNFSNDDIRAEIYFTVMDCYRKLGLNSKAVDILQKFIEYNDENKVGNNKSIYIQISDLMENYDERVEFLKKKVSEIPESAELHLELAEAYILQEKQSPNAEGRKDDIIACFDASIKCNPSLSNMAYFRKFDYSLDKAFEGKAFTTCKKIIEICEDQNPYDVDVVDMCVKLFQKTSDTTDKTEEYIASVKTNNRVYSRLFRYDMILLVSLAEKASIEKIRRQMHYMDNKYSSRVSYILEKSNILLRKFRSPDLAISCLIEYLPRISKENSLNKIKAGLVSLYLNIRDFENAQAYIDEISKKEIQDKMQKKLWETKGDFEKLFEKLEGRLNDTSSFLTIDFYIDYSFQLLRAGRYKAVIEILKPFLQKTDYRNDVLVINYELARKRSDEKFNIERLHKRKDHSDTKDIKAAALMVLSKTANDANSKSSAELIRKEIESNYELFYRYQLFPVFQDLDIKDVFAMPSIPYKQEPPHLEVVNSTTQSGAKNLVDKS